MLAPFTDATSTLDVKEKTPYTYTCTCVGSYEIGFFAQQSIFLRSSTVYIP